MLPGVVWRDQADPFGGRTVADRFDVVRRYVLPPRTVLDLGCVDARPARHDAAERITRTQTHTAGLPFRRIAEVNPDGLTGLDVDADGVAALNGQGYRVICADAETADLGRTFDTVVAGEVIEHLENPGRFLRNLRRHLAPGGTLILSTPNPFYAGSGWKIWRKGRPMVHEDHVNWQDPITLSTLLKRCGYTVTDGFWVQPRRQVLKTWKRLARGYFSHGFLLVATPTGERHTPPDESCGD